MERMDTDWDWKYSGGRLYVVRWRGWYMARCFMSFTWGLVQNVIIHKPMLIIVSSHSCLLHMKGIIQWEPH